jgi:hypothetical protein
LLGRCHHADRAGGCVGIELVDRQVAEWRLLWSRWLELVVQCDGRELARQQPRAAGIASRGRFGGWRRRQRQQPIAALVAEQQPAAQPAAAD